MQRNLAIDLLKTISIFGVVWIHSGSLFDHSSAFSSVISDTSRFGVPSFIAIWAYFVEKGHIQNADQLLIFYKNRFLHLFQVFFFWSLLYLVFTANLSELSLISLFTKHFSGYGWSGQYFFILLFQLLGLFPLTRFVYSKPLFRFITIGICIGLNITMGYFYESLPVLIHKIGDRPFIFWIPFTFLGIYSAHNAGRSFPWWLCIFVIAIPIEFYFLRHLGINHSNYITPGLLIGSSLFILPFLSHDRLQLPRLAHELIGLIGKNTMTLYVANPMIILLILHFVNFRKLDKTLNAIGYLEPVFATLTVTFVCLLLALLLNRTGLRGKIN